MAAQSRSRVLALLALAALLAGPAAAPPAGDPNGDASAPPPVDLDALLRLPAASGVPTSTRDPAERLRWEERFREVRRQLDDAREELARTQRELGELASQSDAWQVAAPGAQSTPENSPISYKLRQEIRDRRDDVDRAERRLRDLEVEASLAGVPPEWRSPPEAAADEPAPGS